MGNSESLSGQSLSPRFLPAEQAEINRLFDALSSAELRSSTSPRSFSLQALKSHVGEALPPEMVTRLFEGMRRVDVTGKTKGPSERISQEQFTVSMSYLLKGNAEEKSLVILKMISATEGPVKAREVKKFTEDLVGSVAHVLSYRQELRGWTQKQAPGFLSRVQALAAQLCSEMKLQGGEKLLGPQRLECDRTTIEDWVFRAPHVATFLSVVIHQGFLLLCSSLDLATLVPERQVDQEREFASVLDVLSVIYINSHLPREQRHHWRLLFSSELHGHSFAQLCGRITHCGPCVVLLEDHDGHVFGGFASCSWEVKPQFQGDDRCFLFSISPSMAVYTSTGYNDHYMYLNQGQQTIPNGLGMGGQHNYFGLWIDVDFGKGHSKAKPTCTTYNSPQLSAQEDFRFEKMEVWAVGDVPVTQLAKNTKSVLDVDPTAQALLEVSGRIRHSEGLREAPEDQ
ncbi:TLD domain-containing protein 1 [Neophocaena asiaeorientalis asiaeorientalis]|uniref:MTOR-associated protein MEAK7 n=1 Tax=Neophocaena asiaeorientalis asiaeorientalis TaxID=1706337 RepID=A0A341APR0_NEOAA|nr:TLD domain-containing protein 1 [Neophocaena asiaeorientalis asiaeorientalis]XP_024591583.1 TLD domain-containing protein 1 [Neophocaena asiaeorientalis asiaeorientalis]XP_024591584.1 TLD domain-containing protein 1 [Neophocaena asiaeorientalis asiaeorientalis]XP_024591585.1 TLD domain-containing protein 1 [Neophocaena asiaeorientalis asiaeorientalis]XP_024591586.1 TLD domain-containing protein 1 [Neophocaena asiaeorientalis asiaeorientalis]